MNKKRLTFYLSAPLAHKLELIGRRRRGAKSALIEEALKSSLEPQQVPGVEDVLVRRLNEMHRALSATGRDVAVIAETLALFVRYFLTITPPLPQSEQEPARLLGKERFQVFVAQIGRRLAGDHRLIAEVLETIAANEPDLLGTASADLTSKGGAGAAAPSAPAQAVPEAEVAGGEGNGHG